MWRAHYRRTQRPPLGATVLRPHGIEEFRKALGGAKRIAGVVVVHVETDPFAHAPDSTSWRDVPVSEVSDLDSTQQAHRTYVDNKARQRPLI